MQLLSNTDLGSEEAKEAVCQLCVDVHMSVTAVADRFFNELRRRYYTTPKSFLDLIQLYCALLAEKRQDMNESRERLLVGLQKLSETNSVVDRMKIELGAMPCATLLPCLDPYTALLIAAASWGPAVASIQSARISLHPPQPAHSERKA